MAAPAFALALFNLNALTVTTSNAKLQTLNRSLWLAVNLVLKASNSRVPPWHSYY